MCQAMTKPLFPVPFDVFHADIDFGEFSAGNSLYLGDSIVFKAAQLNHPNGATGYRVEYDGKSIYYVTDTEHVLGNPDQNILGLIMGADLVIYDGTYADDEFSRYVGWGHSAWQEGARLGKPPARGVSPSFILIPRATMTRWTGSAPLSRVSRRQSTCDRPGIAARCPCR